MLTELRFGKEFEQVPLHIENTVTLHVIGNRAFTSRTKHVALRLFYICELVQVLQGSGEPHVRSSESDGNVYDGG